MYSVYSLHISASTEPYSKFSVYDHLQVQRFRGWPWEAYIYQTPTNMWSRPTLYHTWAIFTSYSSSSPIIIDNSHNALGYALSLYVYVLSCSTVWPKYYHHCCSFRSNKLNFVPTPHPCYLMLISRGSTPLVGVCEPANPGHPDVL